MQKLVDILKDEGAALAVEFRKASNLGEGTPQEIAEFRENAFRTFISRFYPAPYQVVKGKIHDSFGDHPSASIDCVLVNPAHPHLIDSQGKFQLLLADGVDFAIEVKPDLSIRDELHRGLKQGVSVKRLQRIRGPILLTNRKPERVVEESQRIPYFIIAQKGRSDVAETVRDTVAWYASNAVPTENQLDAFAILGLGILRHVKHSAFWPYPAWDLATSERRGWFLEPWNDATLAGMLICTEFSFHSHATVQESVLGRYLRQITLAHVQRILV